MSSYEAGYTDGVLGDPSISTGPEYIKGWEDGRGDAMRAREERVRERKVRMSRIREEERSYGNYHKQSSADPLPLPKMEPLPKLEKKEDKEYLFKVGGLKW
jgi:hypothetical protein